MAFLTMRRPGFRYSPLGIFLVVAVFLLSFYNMQGFNWTPNEFRKPSTESDVRLSPDNVPQATVTVTTVATSIVVVETVRQPPPTPTVPGPAFCEACGPDDTLCNSYGWALSVVNPRESLHSPRFISQRTKPCSFPRV